jgi:hypothetical protein
LKKLLLASALLVPVPAHAPAPAQFYPQQPYYLPAVPVPPPPFDGGVLGGDPMPFQQQQYGTQRLLEMLDTGGIEHPAATGAPPAYVFAGQVFSEGASVRGEDGERQVCAPRPGAQTHAAGQLPLIWQPAPGG